MNTKKIFLEYAFTLCIGILGIIGRNCAFAGVPSNEELYQTIKRVCLDETYPPEQQKSCFLQAILTIGNFPSPESPAFPEHNSANPLITLQSHDAQLSTSEDLAIATEAQELITSEINTLVDVGYLDATDLETLDQKIEVNYVRSCGNTKGSYHMLQSDDRKENLFKGIVLNINLCDALEYRQRLDKFVKQILIHELAHYLYFFKDTKIDTFNQICRENGQTMCQSNDFVSAYAMQGKEEDYAENFVYRYLENHHNSAMIVDQGHQSSPETRVKQAKMQYFDIAYDQL